MEHMEMSGFTYIGQVNFKTKDGLMQLPAYEPAAPKNGRPSINTLEGWNLMRHDLAERKLIRDLGRNPTEAEITAEMARNAAEARKMAAALDHSD